MVKLRKASLPKEEGNSMVKEFPIIETNRLLLRKVTRDDENHMFTYLSDKDVNIWG